MVARHTSITLRGDRKEDRELIFTMETDSFLSNSEMKALCEAVWHKFNTLTNNNPQMWPCLQLYAGCALLPAATENFRTWVVALVLSIFLICCTTPSAPGLSSL